MILRLHKPDGGKQALFCILLIQEMLEARWQTLNQPIIHLNFETEKTLLLFALNPNLALLKNCNIISACCYGIL